GIKNLTGQIDYPKLRQTQKIELTAEKEAELENALREMEKITDAENPPPVEYMKICGSCSYAELCWS
ncbi:MAG: Dna2/Cas4 domain-containing protein, partial [Acidobacteriota bacterium]